MRNPKQKITSLFLAALLLASLAACTPRQQADLALIISEKGTFELNNFHQAAWLGIEDYGTQNDISYAYYEPAENNTAEYKKCIEQAVKNGAKVLVLPGYLLEPAVYEMQDTYPDVHFVLLDGVPNNGKTGAAYESRVGPNTYSVLYAEEQAGFLAGYAAVMDGFRNLGFFGGMSVPAVIRFGYGYIQGAEYAAQTLGLGRNSVEVKYIYCGGFTPDPQYQAEASNWYWQGTEVIFACGGAIGQSVMKAAEDATGSKWVIGVDTDQSADSPTILTSALKQIEGSVWGAIDASYSGTFPGGQSIFLGADVDGIGLAMTSARFSTFSLADYDEIFTALATDQDGITNGILRDDVSMDALPVSCVRIVMENFR